MPKSPDAFRTISEVSEWLDTPAHVLRFWESKFSQVKPVKRAGGRRYYRPDDMELLGGIKKLLHEDGLTIKGVQKLLREQGVKHVASLGPSLDDEESATEVVATKPEAEVSDTPASVDPTPDERVADPSDKAKEADAVTPPETPESTIEHDPRQADLFGDAPASNVVSLPTRDAEVVANKPSQAPRKVSAPVEPRTTVLQALFSANPAKLAKHKKDLRPIVERLEAIVARSSR